MSQVTTHTASILDAERDGRDFVMTKVRVTGFSVSLDGFGAGPEQSLENPLGKRGQELHPWFIRRAPSRQCWAKAAAQPVLMMNTRTVRWTGSALSSLAAICLGRSAVHGPTTIGKAGGVRIRPTTRRLSC